MHRNLIKCVESPPIHLNMSSSSATPPNSNFTPQRSFQNEMLLLQKLFPDLPSVNVSKVRMLYERFLDSVEISGSPAIVEQQHPKQHHKQKLASSTFRKSTKRGDTCQKSSTKAKRKSSLSTTRKSTNSHTRESPFVSFQIEFLDIMQDELKQLNQGLLEQDKSLRLLIQKWNQFHDTEDLNSFFTGFEDLCIWRRMNRVAFHNLEELLLKVEQALRHGSFDNVDQLKKARKEYDKLKAECAFFKDHDLLREYKNLKQQNRQKVVRIVSGEEEDGSTIDSEFASNTSLGRSAVQTRYVNIPLIPLSMAENDVVLHKPTGIHNVWLEAALNMDGMPIRTPLTIVCGSKSGPTVGIFVGLDRDDTMTFSETIWKLCKCIDPENNFRGRLLIMPHVNQAQFTPSADKSSSYVRWCDSIYTHVASHCEFTVHLQANSDLPASFHNLMTVYGDLSKPTLRRNMYALESDALIPVKFFNNWLLRKIQENGIGCLRVEMGESGKCLSGSRLVCGLVSLLAQIGMLPQERSSIVNYVDNDHVPFLCSGFSDMKMSQLGGMVLCDVDKISQSNSGKQQMRVYSPGQILSRSHDVFGNVLSKITVEEDCIVLWCKESRRFSHDSTVIRIGTLRSYFHVE